MSVTEVMAVATLAALLMGIGSGAAGPAFAVVGTAAVLRLAQHGLVRTILPTRTAGTARLIPARDLLSLAVRVASFFGTKVLWREQAFVIHDDNRLEAAD